jgi:hypothetical protein
MRTVMIDVGGQLDQLAVVGAADEVALPEIRTAGYTIL